MKGLSSSRSHHHTLTSDPSYDSLNHHSERRPYSLGPPSAHKPAADNHHAYYGCQSECTGGGGGGSGPYGNLSCSTFPRRQHYSSHHELKDECALVPYIGPSNPILSTKAKPTQPACQSPVVPATLLEQFERQQPVRRDGYHTLQYKRTAHALEHTRSDSPSRIRHLVHSVQKLFTKSHSLEGPTRGSVNGNEALSPDSATLTKQTNNKHSKSKDRNRAESKTCRLRSPVSGYWSSDDTLDPRQVCLYHRPSGVMTMGRHPEKSQSHYFLETYNTLGGSAARQLKTSQSNNDVGKCSTCSGLTVGFGGPLTGDATAALLKKSSWSSTLTVSRARQVFQKGNVNLDKALIKAPPFPPGHACQFLQVPQNDWRGLPALGGDDEIPCRRMRSGSYIKAMAEDDSGESDISPKHSPKAQTRRASYLKATQPSLTEMTTLKISSEHSPKLQIRSHSYLRAVSEVSINRSLDSLDPVGLLASPKFRSRNESYMRAMSTISQVSEVEVNGQLEAVCESVFSELESQAVDALDLPLPGCFRIRSHSYVRAIEKGCSQEEDERSAVRAISPPRTTTVRTIQSSTVSSCITTYKKTPPPVPPRSTPTQPYISITAQSSTESAQDAFYGEGSSMVANRALAGQQGLSNSTESIDSMKALTAAIEAANAQVHGPASQHVTSSTITITAATTNISTVSQDDQSGNKSCKKDALRKCLSIGIQVDGPEQAAVSEEQCKFQSVGIQVEDERCSRRVTRSNSVTTAVQADLGELQEGSGCPSNFLSRDAATSTVSIQGSGNHYHACSQDDYSEVGFDPSILPPPDPWMDGGSVDEVEVKGGGVSVCPRDGRWFLKLLHAEMERMEGWCQQMEQEESENELSDEILGKIRSAVGSAQLLMTQKFQQFRELCEENLNPNAHPRPISQDLAGFWDMLQLSIENISLKFDELHQLKGNNWKLLDPPEKKERKVPPPIPKKPGKGHALLARDRSLEGSQRLEARKRLLAAKRAATLRQSSATESADSIEIYIPEAQTRL
uniref:Disks large-associated protein 1-like n=1 Tax=Denticeps clupeoides TaxID=299321 RepID=A0AAY4BWN2_9TELE